MSSKKRVSISRNRTIPEEYTLPQYIKVPDKPILYNRVTKNFAEIETLELGQVNTIGEGIKYCFDIIDGNIPSCKHVRLACERFIKQLNNPPDGFKFYPEKINHFLWFANQLKHSVGSMFIDTPLILSPWQVLLICMCYGFYKKSVYEATGKTIYDRLARTVFVHIPRKNGKSVMTSVIGIYELAYGEPGAEIVSLATKQEQAAIVFKAAKAFIVTAPKHIQDLFVVSNSMLQKNGDVSSNFKALSKETKKTGDGKNIVCALIDEAAAITDPASIEVLQSSTGARVSSMMIYLTSGGHNKETKFYRELLAYRTMLEGIAEDNPTVQGLAYTLDDKELWDKEIGWQIACPNLDISVRKQSYIDDVNTLKLEPSGLNEFLCKKLNIYVSNEKGWISTDKFDDKENIIATDNYTKEVESFMGIDLSAVNDLTAVVRLNRTYVDGNYDEPIYNFSYKYFYTIGSLKKIPSHLRGIYDNAIKNGELIIQPGDAINQMDVAKYLIQEYIDKPYLVAAYDQYNISSILDFLNNNKVPTIRTGQSMRILSDPTKVFQMAYDKNRIKHVHSPFTSWQLANCAVYTDVNNNIKVGKGDDQNNRIDGIIASIIALTASINNPRIPDLSFESKVFNIY